MLDNGRMARSVATLLPTATIAGALVTAFAIGAATSILVLAAGVLLGVIALLWASVRMLSGGAELSEELAALDLRGKGGSSTLALRKKMLLRSLKDLESEHAIGKLEREDFDELSANVRSELKHVMKRLDDLLAPHRAEAEALASAHLAKLQGEPAKERPETKAAARLACASCDESNEPDATFCKRCGTKLQGEP